MKNSKILLLAVIALSTFVAGCSATSTVQNSPVKIQQESNGLIQYSDSTHGFSIQYSPNLSRDMTQQFFGYSTLFSVSGSNDESLSVSSANVGTMSLENFNSELVKKNGIGKFQVVRQTKDRNSEILDVSFTYQSDFYLVRYLSINKTTFIIAFRENTIMPFTIQQMADAIDTFQIIPIVKPSVENIPQPKTLTYTKAIQVSSNTTKSNKVDPALIEQGQIQMNMKNYTGAIGTYSQLATQEPNNPVFHLTLAKAYLANTQYSSAIYEANKCLNLNTSSAQKYAANDIAGQAEQAQGNALRAAQYYESALQVDPNNISLCEYVINTYVAAGEYTNAANFCDTLTISGAHGNQGLLEMMANAYQLAGESTKSEACYSAIVAANANNPQVLSQIYYQKAVNAYKSQNYSQSIQYANQVLMYDNKNIYTYGLLLQIYLEQKNSKMASQVYGQFKKNDSQGLEQAKKGQIGPYPLAEQYVNSKWF